MALAYLLLTAATSLAQAPVNPSVEYQVKAAFLLNFTKFIEWPTNVFSSEKAPIIVCIFRYDPFGSALDEIIQGRSINNHELLARRISELGELKKCQVAFVSQTEEKHLPEILNGVKGTSVLVVGEGEGFAERGGGIQFFFENNKMRFAINVDAVERARLNVSSKLLALARTVHDQGHPKGN
jgi:YfiR/HmsC-like